MMPDRMETLYNFGTQSSDSGHSLGCERCRPDNVGFAEVAMNEASGSVLKGKLGVNSGAPTPVEHRRIFLSHAHGDKELAESLADLIQTAYSGIVEAFASSQAAPQQGLQPGELWYPAIHSHLQLADAVWVLATPYSLAHPWVYWEAGIGSVLSQVVVIRVGLTNGVLASPLNQFQTFDGLVIGDGGMGELIQKAGAQFGMTIPDVLLGVPVQKWVTYASGHSPTPTSGTEVGALTPERIEKIEQAIARLENGVIRLEGVSVAAAGGESNFSGVSRFGAQRPARLLGLQRITRSERAAREAALRTRFERPDDEGTLLSDEEEVFGAFAMIVESRREFLDLLHAIPEDSVLTTAGFDHDGDLVLVGHRSGRSATAYLRGDWLDSPDGLSADDSVPARFHDLMHHLRGALLPDA